MSAVDGRAVRATRNRPLGARLGLAVVGLANLEVGVWGTAAPHAFYTSFPGFGRHWVAPMGPYDEHLLRDYAAAEIGFAVLLICAAIWSTRQVVLIAGAAFVAGTVPHLAYHLTTTGMLSIGDNVASLGAFAIEIAVVAAAMVAVHRGGRDDAD